MANLSNAPSSTITAAYTSQPISAANPGRTYWCFQNQSPDSRMWLGIGANASQEGGSIEVDPRGIIDSAAVPELTQASLAVMGDVAGRTFTYLEVA